MGVKMDKKVYLHAVHPNYFNFINIKNIMKYLKVF